MLALYILLGIFAFIFLIGLIMPKRYAVEKSIVINRAPQQVFLKVADLQYCRDWNPWQKMDPDPAITIGGTPATPGHYIAWEGKKIGTGRMTIQQVEVNRSVDFDLQFFKPWAARADDSWRLEDLGEGQTKATWRNSGELPYLMARLMGPMLKKNLNYQFDRGLNNLKSICEA